jgi:hypothetical protein
MISGNAANSKNNCKTITQRKKEKEEARAALVWFMVFNVIFNNISVISCWQLWQ